MSAADYWFDRAEAEYLEREAAGLVKVARPRAKLVWGPRVEARAYVSRRAKKRAARAIGASSGPISSSLSNTESHESEATK